MNKSKLNLLTKGLFSKTINEEDILREVAPGKLVYGERLLSSGEKNNLISQARFLKTSELYKLLLDEMVFLCEKKIYLDSKDHFDLAVGKMGLWLMRTLQKKIDLISNMKPDVVPQKK